MAQIIFTIPDEKMTELCDGVAWRFGYKAQIMDTNGDMIANPENCGQFARRMLVKLMKDSVKKHKLHIEKEASNAATDADAIAITTN